MPQEQYFSPPSAATPSATSETAPAPMPLRAKLAVVACALTVVVPFGATVAKQAIEADGCLVKPTNNPLTLATASFADVISQVIDGPADAHACGE